MKKLSKTLIITVLSVFLVAGSAMAISINFMGTYEIVDTVEDGFFEDVRINTGHISVVDPETDSIFGDSAWEQVVFPSSLTLVAPLTIDGTGDSSYSFNPTTYTDGFKVYDNDGTTLLLDADLTVEKLDIVNTGGDINSAFTMNLTDISTYASSTILDAFSTAPGGATNISLQLAGTNLGAALEGGVYANTIKSTYSGSAAPVPEPTTMLLLGSGLIGLARFGRKKKFFKKG